MPTRAHLLVLVLLVAVGRASTALLPSPLIVVVVRLERARADAATTRARATLRGVAIVEFALRAKPRLELRLWVVVLRGLRDPIHLVPVQVRHGTVIPAIASSARGGVVRSVRGSRVRRRRRRGTLKGLAGTRRGGGDRDRHAHFLVFHGVLAILILLLLVGDGLEVGAPEGILGLVEPRGGGIFDVPEVVHVLGRAHGACRSGRSASDSARFLKSAR